LLASFAVGFLLRSAQLKKHHKHIIELEREMLSNHSEILELQKEKAQLIKQMKESSIPVIPLKLATEDIENTGKKFGAGQ